jgi:rhomboid family protein
VIPLRDNLRARSFPFVNLLLIAANVAVFAYELRLGRRLDPFIFRYGLVPAAWTAKRWSRHLTLASRLRPLLTSMFLHGGWLHLIGNMWFLYIFGHAVEDRLGHARYLLFYLASGVAAGLVQVWATWGSTLPTIGASGAIAGVMGAYFVLFPLARIATLVPLFLFFPTIEVPAFFFLGLWFVMQLLSSGGPDYEGVAWWAHVGGFAAGALAVRRLKRRARRDVYFAV